VDHGGASSTYPKCEACGLTGHKADQCHPLVNYCVAQAMIAQHPDLVRHITAAYKKFPRHVRSRTPRKATVKQLVAVLDLQTFGETSPDPIIAALTPDDSTNFVTRLGIQDPAVFHCRVGTALVTYRDQPWYIPADETPVQSFAPVDIPLNTCLLFLDDPGAHTVSHLNSGRDMLIDLGSTITTKGTNDGLMEYVSPSPSGIRMRSATGQIVRPTGEGALSFSINDDKASLAVVCQHTPAITSSIFSPAETCDTLDYDTYVLTCNRCDSTSTVLFTRLGHPDIVFRGTYKLRMPYISLPSPMAHIQSVTPMTYQFPSVKAELLADNNNDAVHQVLR
jgi:hypothetical protein